MHPGLPSFQQPGIRTRVARPRRPPIHPHCVAQTGWLPQKLRAERGAMHRRHPKVRTGRSETGTERRWFASGRSAFAEQGPAQRPRRRGRQILPTHERPFLRPSCTAPPARRERCRAFGQATKKNTVSVRGASLWRARQLGGQAWPWRVCASVAQTNSKQGGVRHSNGGTCGSGKGRGRGQ